MQGIYSRLFAFSEERRSLTSPYRYAWVGGGPFADAVGDRLSRTLVRQKVFRFVDSSYNLYRKGDFLGAHTDLAQGEIDVLALVAGPATCFYSFPHLVGTSMGTLYVRTQEGDGLLPEPAETPLVEPGDAVVFRGSRLLHQRPPVSEVLLFARFLFDEPEMR